MCVCYLGIYLVEDLLDEYLMESLVIGESDEIELSVVNEVELGVVEINIELSVVEVNII